MVFVPDTERGIGKEFFRSDAERESAGFEHKEKNCFSVVMVTAADHRHDGDGTIFHVSAMLFEQGGKSRQVSP
jgi:hypothetical protein